MRYYADLHVHSKYALATSRDADLEHLALGAANKGVTVLGTGDFTHPAWLAEIQQKLVPAEPGLFRLQPELERWVEDHCPASVHPCVRFILQVEIATIYRKGGRARRVHHCVYAPDLTTAQRIIKRLARHGHLASDGRPMLGLDSHDLLEIVLAAGERTFLIPAHIWTPWYAVLGSKSGFDSIEECYGDLSPHIFAVETGLSSDPAMNWRVSKLDRFQLVSNSDAHSPGRIAREACVFNTGLNYFDLRRALEKGRGYEGTVEFFPEGGKYHWDGHRNCRVCLAPHETKVVGGQCPVCGQKLTVGVLHRVLDLADRPEGIQPVGAKPFRSLISLTEVLAEILKVGPMSLKVQKAREELLKRHGSELFILEQAPLEEIQKHQSELLAEGLARLRRSQVLRHAGYDGEYGRIRLFNDDELPKKSGQL
jgi:DNA helicase II / ATP-dependent DNA helicase PcrA